MSNTTPLFGFQQTMSAGTSAKRRRRRDCGVTKPSLEFILNQFRSHSGLYVVGAGASAGLAPLGPDFWTLTPINFLQNLGGVSVDIPAHSGLVGRMLESRSDLGLQRVFPDREVRPGSSSDFPMLKLLDRIPNYYARTHLKSLLAKPAFEDRQCDNYRVFRYFASSILANYNHDGLAEIFCGSHHRVVDMHGTIHPVYGSPEMMDHIDSARKYHLPDTLDDILMGEPEEWDSPDLARKLNYIVTHSKPTFIAVIGYTFANRKASDFDDWVSLCRLSERFRRFPGNVYVIAPDPYEIQAMLSDRLQTRTVFGVRSRWNLLAHAFMTFLTNCRERSSINKIHEQLLDVFGGGAVFPVLDSPRSADVARRGISKCTAAL
jgi:hypothetical protein